MRTAPFPSATATASRLRLLLAVMLVLGAAQWSAAPAAAAGGGPVSRFVAAESAADVVLPREGALQVERKVKKEPSTGASLDVVSPPATMPVPALSRGSRVDPARTRRRASARRSCGPKPGRHPVRSDLLAAG